MPDANAVPLDAVLAAEDARVLRVLADLHLLHALTQRRTVADAILARDSSLLGALRNARCMAGRSQSWYNGEGWMDHFRMRWPLAQDRGTAVVERIPC